MLHSVAQDAVKQFGSDGAIGERCDRLAGLRQRGIALRIEHRAVGARCSHPLHKFLGRNRVDVEVHVGESRAAVICRHSSIGSGMVGLQMKARHHPGHRVDLAAELRHEEAVHDTRRGQFESDWRPHGDGQLIDGSQCPGRDR